MKPKVMEELKKILDEIRDADDVAEVEKVIAEIKGKISLEPAKGFWEDKSPCWEMCHCPEAIRDDCPAYTHQALACWAIEGTYCKLTDYGTRGDDISICRVCRVYKRWGAGEPIELKLLGKGINSAIAVGAKAAT